MYRLIRGFPERGQGDCLFSVGWSSLLAAQGMKVFSFTHNVINAYNMTVAAKPLFHMWEGGKV
jgi:hypothetical protein